MTDRQHVMLPLRIFEGGDCLRKLNRELARVGSRRAVIFCGATLARESSPLGLVKDAAGETLVGVFAGVKAHSPLPDVEAGADLLRRLEADAVIAVGGGSAIVTARAASILVAETGDIHDLCTSRDQTGKLTSPKLLAPKLPQVIVPTTPTTAMSKAGSAVLDPESKSRLALFDPKTRAGSIFLHPSLLASAPEQLYVDAGINTFCSAVEGLMSKAGDPISDALLMHAVRVIADRLSGRNALDKPAARIDLAYAAIMSGQGTNHTAGGITTALGHAIAAHCGIEAGRIKLIVLPHAITFNAEAARTGLRKLSDALGVQSGSGEDGSLASKAISELTNSLALPLRLSDLGLDRGCFGEIADKAMSDWFLKGNPRPVHGHSDLLPVLEAAW